MTFAGIKQVREKLTPQLTPREMGTITSVATGIDNELFDVTSGFEALSVEDK